MPFFFEVDILSHAGSVLKTFRPRELSWTYQLGNGGPGTIMFGVALSDPVLTSDGGGSGDTLHSPAPYAHDYMLRIRSGAAGTNPEAWGSDNLQGGIITKANVKGSEGMARFAGVDWLHGLEQPFPFDYTRDVATRLASNLDTDFWLRFSGASADTLEDVVTALIDPIASDSDRIAFTTNYVGAAFAEVLDYMLGWGATSTVLQELQGLAAMADPLGFDFWVDPDKTIQLNGPRLIDPGSITPAASMIGAGQIVDYDWTNNGPVATEHVGIGSGSGNAAGYFQDDYAPSIATYRRWLKVFSVADAAALVTDADSIEASAAAQAHLDRFPHKELVLTIKPDAIDPSDDTAWFFSQIGEAIDVDYTFPGGFHRIDANFYVTAQSFRNDGENNWVCDLSLDQVYV